MHVATAHIGDVHKRDAAKHEQQQEKATRRLQGFIIDGSAEPAKGLFAHRALHRHLGAGIYTFEKPRTIGRNTVVHRAEVNGTEHAHVGGDGVPLQPAVQQMVLKALQPGRSQVLEIQSLLSFKFHDASQSALIHMGGAHTPFLLQLGNDGCHVGKKIVLIHNLSILKYE